MTKLRAGVIGVGSLGQHHARLYATGPHATLAGVVDADGARARQVAEKHGSRVFESAEALLRAVDLVSVAVPTSEHYQVARRCLEAGVPTLVEKPLAATVKEAQELATLARSRGVALQVGHIERFNPVLRAARPFIRRPAFIECHRLSPFGVRGTDVDVVLDLMIHDLDMVLSFNPGSIEDIRAAGVPVLTATNDIANARIEFSSGCVANLTASRVSTSRMRRMRLFQREAYVSVDYQTRQGIVCRRGVDASGAPTLHTDALHGGEDEPLKLEIEAFLQAVASRTQPPVTGDDGVAAMELAGRVLEAIGLFLERHRQESAE